MDRILLCLLAALAVASGPLSAAGDASLATSPQSSTTTGAGISATVTAHVAQDSPRLNAGLFKLGQTAAAYQVDEHIFGHENHVTGLNTSIIVRVEAKGEQRRVLVTAPVDKFKTDSGLRDGRVSKLLGGSANIPVLVSSDWFPASDLSELETGTHQMSGEVSVQGKAAPVTLTAQGNGKLIRVDVVTSFTGLGVKPPSLGLFGMLGVVHQPLTLSAQIILDQVSIEK